MTASLTAQEAAMLDALQTVADSLLKEGARIEGWQYVIPFSAITSEELKCLRHVKVDGDRQVVYVPILEGVEPFQDWEFDASPDNVKD